MFCNSRCGCNCNCCMNSCRATPIIGPRKVCTCCSHQLVEQPIICPVECRHINNLVYYPRFYPRYERTFMTQSSSNPFVNNMGPGFNSGNNMSDNSYFDDMNNSPYNGGCGR